MELLVVLKSLVNFLVSKLRVELVGKSEIFPRWNFEWKIWVFVFPRKHCHDSAQKELMSLQTLNSKLRR